MILSQHDFCKQYGWANLQGGGFLHGADLATLVALTRFVKAKRVLEIGVQEGTTARLLLDHCPTIRRYIGVDVPPGTPTPMHFQQHEVPHQAGRLAREDARFKLVVTPNGSRDLKPTDFEPFDLIFIDGDHSLEGVEHDTALARRMLAPGGVVVWHDYTTVESVRTVLDGINEREHNPICLVEGSATCFAWADELTLGMQKILLQHYGSPGDWLCMAGGLHAIWKRHPEYKFKLDTVCPEIFDHAPWQWRGGNRYRTITVDYGWAVRACDREDLRFLPSFYIDICNKLGLKPRLTTNRPHIYFSPEEMALPRQIDGDYCVINSGWKHDYPIKNWGFQNWQDVTDWILREKSIKVVQVGQVDSDWHVHRPLKGAIDLRSATDTRSLYRLAYHSKFGLGHESYLHHIYAAHFHTPFSEADRASIPFVCVASGWNPKVWCSYNTEAYVTRQGQLDCCRPGGCWRDKLADCKYPETVADEIVGRCMQMIPPSEAIAAIESFYLGNSIY